MAATPSSGTPVPADNVALGQTAYVDGPLVMPVAVLEDSRCPTKVRCVWAGRVRLKMLWVRGNGERQPFEVTLGQPTPLADGSFTLTEVRPTTQADRAIALSDYRFSFRFDGGL